MEEKDLTVIFLTTNKVPDGWAAYHRQVLLDAVSDYPLITISKKPLDFGQNVIQTEPESSTNLYRQLLRGAKLATTPYIALTEDDTLYTKDHFKHFRPPLDTFGYNMNRWSLFTWGEPIYSRKNNIVGAAMIAPRELAIEALEERFQKWPDGMPHRICGELGLSHTDRALGVTPRKVVEFYSFDSIIQFNHDYFSTIENTPEQVQRRHKKRMGFVRAYDIPHWGKSADLVKHFK